MERGGVSIPVFDCVFNGAESITSFTREFDPNFYRILPNLYAVCVATSSHGQKKIAAGFFVKTSYHHNDPEFSTILASSLETSPNLARFHTLGTSFFPSRLNVPDSEPLSEIEMLHTMLTLFTKHSVGGHG
ncbi:hypothetical protein [Acidovorax sp. SUPP3334]|uniref:hypothetical protein n=1 Tax=Acidovorax sp. SUPP3334 TaxID=2920881 RepID=UPI0023DE4F90|nr:hypothetical protein [Acidovorax sp. SUPP3334]GKT25082.1 hypothetical protein AVHM3334_16810 [Acidovorax sp. SUPP3334]